MPLFTFCVAQNDRGKVVRRSNLEVIKARTFARVVIAAVIATAAFPLMAEEKPKQEPKITSVSPLAVSPGSTTVVKIVGLKLDQATGVRWGAAAEAEVATTQPVDPAQGQPSTQPTTQPSMPITSKGKAAVPAGMDAANVGEDLLEIKLTLPADVPEGELKLVVDTPAGPAAAASLLVKRAEDLLDEKEPNNGFREAQPIESGKLVRGSIQAAGDV